MGVKGNRGSYASSVNTLWAITAANGSVTSGNSTQASNPQRSQNQNGMT